MSDIVLAILLGTVAAIAFGFVPFFARLGLVHLRTNTGVLTSMLAGLVVVGLFAVPLHIRDMFAISMLTLLWLAILGFVNYRLGRFFNYTSVQLIGVARATPLLATAPLWATLAAIIFLGETPNVATLLGVVTVVGGVALIVSERS